MAYSQTKQTTDIERKLSQLKTQLYGKEQTLNLKTPHQQPMLLDDQKHISRDLMKTVVFGSLAVIFQIGLFLIVQSGLIRI